MKQKKSEIWDELANMEPKRVKLAIIYLDPNNPRIETPESERIPDERIGEDSIQDNCMQEIRNIGITDLTESIKTSGFWTVDRVVLKPLDTDKYVVVEGNRRISALKTLLKSHKGGKINLPREVLKTMKEFEAMIYKGNNTEIAWIIQGFRHTPGIKSWERYPQAKFFAKLKEKTEKSVSDIASIFGMKRRPVTHLIRSFYGFEQAKEDEDYGDLLEPNKFGHFDEVIMERDSIKTWMGWDDKKNKFTKTDKLKTYLSWAVPTEEGEKPRIDISPITRDVLSKLVLPENRRLFEKFNSGELDLIQCKASLDKEETEREASIDIMDVIKNLESMKRELNRLPIPKLKLVKSREEKSERKQVCDLLEDLVKILEIQIKNLKT